MANAPFSKESFSDSVCWDAGGGSGAVADGEPGADEFAAGDCGVSAGGVCGAREASGVTEDAAEVVAADSEEERGGSKPGERSNEIKRWRGKEKDLGQRSQRKSTEVTETARRGKGRRFDGSGDCKLGARDDGAGGRKCADLGNG